MLRRVSSVSEAASVEEAGIEAGGVSREEIVRATPLTAKTEEAGEVGAETAASMVQAAQPIPVDEIIEGVVGKVGETLRSSFEENTKILVERLDRIEENIGRLRKELQSLVSSMENIIVEFREALSELTNPLTTPSLPPAQSTLSQLSQPIATPTPSSSSHRLFNLVNTFTELLKRTSLDVVEQLIRDYRDAGVLSDKEAERLSIIARTIARLRERGIDEQTIVSVVASLLTSRQEG